MRIITEDNVDQLLSMSYSDNIKKLMKSNKAPIDVVRELNDTVNKTLREQTKEPYNYESPVIPEPVQVDTNTESPEYAPGSPAYVPDVVTPEYAPGSPAYMPETGTIEDESEYVPYNQNGSEINDSQKNIQETNIPLTKTNESILEVQDEKTKEKNDNNEENNLDIETTNNEEEPNEGSSNNTKRIITL
jgi:hypothetical protein